MAKKLHSFFKDKNTIGSIILGYGIKQLQDSFGAFNEELIRMIAKNDLLASFYGILYGIMLIAIGIKLLKTKKGA